MVNCPKCGFAQPQDQYCERCGIDMIAFRPMRKPFFERLIGSTVFQIVFLVLIVTVVFTFARRQRHLELAARRAEIENAENAEVMVKREQAGVDKSKGDFASASPQNSAAPASASSRGEVAADSPP